MVQNAGFLSRLGYPKGVLMTDKGNPVNHSDTGYSQCIAVYTCMLACGPRRGMSDYCA